MKRIAAIAPLLVSLPFAVTGDDEPATQALGQFAWQLADTLPPIACRGQDADLDAAAMALFADPRMDVIRAWLEQVRLPLPPQTPPGDWPVARCRAAVEEAQALLDGNGEHIERMAGEVRGEG